MTATDIYAKLDSYGVSYQGDQGFIPTDVAMNLAELAAQGGKIVKVRWIGGDYIPGRGKCYDLSYCTGQLPDGRMVAINALPAAFLIPKNQLKKALIDWAKEERVFAKGLGLLDDGRFSILG